ncbi:ProQ/FINO family protein [Methylobacterium aquaticum]|uniref:ProQ/FINO family protein n=1 Tax=Methylobacterium aquaticum TaxID=270351 RepID=UPI003CCA690E
MQAEVPLRCRSTFQVGLGPEILARRRPEVAVDICERAIRDYVRSFSYRHAVAQPGSLRYDLDGNPVEPVSEKDRHDMQRNCEVDRERTRQRKTAAAIAAAVVGAETGWLCRRCCVVGFVGCVRPRGASPAGRALRAPVAAPQTRCAVSALRVMVD